MKQHMHSAMSYQQEATEVASIHTQADPDYLPIRICGDFLSSLWEKHAWSTFTGVMIILTIPVRPERLTHTVVTGKNTSISQSQDIDIVISESTIQIPIWLRSGTIHKLRLR